MYTLVVGSCRRKEGADGIDGEIDWVRFVGIFRLSRIFFGARLCGLIVRSALDDIVLSCALDDGNWLLVS